jgi:hypothetical protein
MNEKMKWYLLIAAALLLGMIMGYFTTVNLSTEGNSKIMLNNNLYNNTEMYITQKECNMCRSCHTSTYGAKKYCVSTGSDGRIYTQEIVN